MLLGFIAFRRVYKSYADNKEAMSNAYYAEFGTSMWERFKANLVYRLLRTDYKIKAELNGRTIIGAFRYAELIALELLYSQLRLKETDEKIQALEGLYFLKKTSMLLLKA